MAVSLVTVIRWFVGLSTDTKPDDAPAGSRFLEFDTPSWWIFDGANWQEQP
jgi:hypothetical protein